MSDIIDDELAEEFPVKQKGLGRLRDVAKKLRVQSHELGSDCKCKRLKCFEQISENERKTILKKFNEMSDRNEQNAYLASLITIHQIKRRRNRSEENYASLHDCSYGFRVKVIRENIAEEIPVCIKAFAAIHGITRSKIEYVQKSLKFEGKGPKDKRGTHSTRIHKLPVVTRQKIDAHIKSFKGRKSHYSLNKTKKMYLPEDLNIKKMYGLFKEKYPQVNISYETYRKNFKLYNVSFGYPRSDTCSTCDKYLADMKNLDNSNETFVEARRRKLTTLNDVHKAKAQNFYSKKRTGKNHAKTDASFEAIALDYQKNISLPNVTTNDAYYNRQLSMYSFNIHILSSGKSVFYTYPETVGKKGSNEVISFLYNFVFQVLDERVQTLEIFCDSAGGQNKNQSMFKFIHYLVHYRRRFTSIKITFPIRGHSYLECDKNFGLVNFKTQMETPSDWYDLLRISRVKPEPFIVVVVEQNMIRDWSSLLSSLRYVKKLTFKIQEIRQIEAKYEHPRLLFHRSSYNGALTSSIVTSKIKPNERYQLLRPREFFYPDAAYTGKRNPFFIDKFYDYQIRQANKQTNKQTTNRQTNRQLNRQLNIWKNK